jgi:hypothetical protein
MAGSRHASKRCALALLLRACTRANVPAFLSWEAIGAGVKGVAFGARCPGDRYAGEWCATTGVGAACYSRFIAAGGDCTPLNDQGTHEKMLSTFFKMSRSFCVLSNFRLSRRISSSWAV